MWTNSFMAKGKIYWSGHHNDVRDWCQNCGTWVSCKSPAPKAKAALPNVVAGYPMQLVAVALPRVVIYMLVAADYFVK